MGYFFSSQFSGDKNIRTKVEKTGMSGFLTQMIQEGEIQEGDEIELLERPHPSITVRKCQIGLYHGLENEDMEEFYRSLTEIDELAERRWKALARTKLGRILEKKK